MTFPDLLGLFVLFALAAALTVALGAASLLHALRRPRRKTYAVALGQGLATDPGEMGLAFESATFSLTDGTATPGWIVTGGNPDGPAVFIVHGFADSRYGALTWAPLLVPHASKLVLYDLRGHGEAESKHAHCGTTDAADLLGIIDQSHVQGPVVLLGYSMGGGIAIAAAGGAAGGAGAEDADPPVDVAGVIADGPYRHWDEPIRCYFRARGYPVWPIVPLAGLLLRLTIPGFTGFDRARHAERLRCPLLVLHGDADWLCPAQSAADIAQAAPGGEMVNFPAGAHLDLAAVDEASYRAALASFFQRLPSR